MKKFFSVFCALAMVMSVIAAPQAKKELVLKNHQRVAQLVKNQHVAPKKNAAKKAGKTIAFAKMEKENTAKVAFKKASMPIAKAPKAEYAPEIGSVTFDYYASTSDVYYILTTADGQYVFTFDILLTEGQDVESGVVYTFAENMDADYTCLYDGATKEWISDFTDASFKKVVAEDGSYTIEASATLTNGDVYTLNAQVSAYIPQTFDITMTQMDFQFYSTDGDAYYKLSDTNEDYIFAFDIFVAEGLEDVELGKTYTLADMDPTYSKGIDYILYTNVNYASAEFTKTLDVDGLIQIAAKVVDLKGNIYNLTYAETPFVPSGDTIRIDFGNTMTAPFFYSDGSVDLRASNENYTAQLCYFVITPGSAAGSYVTEDFDMSYTYIYVGETKLAIVEAELEVVETEASINATANLLAEDGDVYAISMVYVFPVVEKQVMLEASNLEINDAYLDWFGVVFLEASNATDTISLTVNAEGIGEALVGEYTIGTDVNGSVNTAEGSFDIATGTIQIAYEAGNYTVTGVVLAANNTEYTLLLTYQKPTTPTREEALVFTNGELNLLNGAWQIMAEDLESGRAISIAAYGEAASGEYTEENLALGYTSIYYLNEAGSATERYDVLTANLTIAFNLEDTTAVVSGTIFAQGYVDNTDLPLFSITLTAAAPVPSPYLDYDEEDADFIENFASYSINDQWLEQYGDLIISATNDNGAMVGLDMYIAAGQSTLTPGEYAINKSEEPMTLYTGSCDGTNVYYSFVGYTNEQGNITNMWFPVSGSVVVDENGVITIDALNSYGRAIKAVIGSVEEGINNTDATVKATKRVVNGQLIIEKNGVRYNAIGTIVK